jgi:hypothetical protein
MPRSSCDTCRMATECGDIHPVHEAVWPKSPRGTQRTPLAPRIATLDGRRIGFVWDYMFRGEEVFPALADELTRRYPGVEVVGYEAFGNVHGPDEAAVVGQLPAALRKERIDAVVVGNGC